jgi:chromosome segregation ATPase
LQGELAESRESLRAPLASADCATLSAAETAVTQRRDLQKGIESAEEKLNESLEDFESMEDLQSKLMALDRQTKAMSDTLRPDMAETNASVTELESALVVNDN